MLHARASAPYERSGFTVTSSDEDWAIWWWDQALVEAAVGERFGRRTPGVMPEPLAHQVTEGWRQVRVSSGWDLQWWRDGALRFSTWRRSALDQPGFDRLSRVLGENGPETFPSKWDPFLLASSTLWWRSRPPVDYPALAKGAAVLLAVAALGASIGLQIRAGRVSDEADAVQARIEVLEAQSGRADFPEMQRRRQELADYERLTSEPNPMASLAVAVAALQLYDITPQAFQANGEATRLTIPYEALPLSRELAADLQGEGSFTSVELSTTPNRGGIQIEMTNRPSSTIR